MTKYMVLGAWLVACGSPSGTRDAGAGDGSAADALSDAVPDTTSDTPLDGPEVDAAIDAMMGTLSPEPPMPTSTPCAGILGFPNPPMLPEGKEPHVGDLDGDGLLDVAMGDGTDLDLARGHGNGTYTKFATITAPGFFSTFALVDMTLDGRPDLLVHSTVSQTAAMYIAVNDGAGNFGAFTRIESTNNVPAKDFVVADVDKDNRPDIVTVGENSVAVVRRTADLGYVTPEVYTVGSGQLAYDAAVSDLTGDGYPEIVATNSNTLHVLINQGGTFASSVAYSTTNGQPRAVEIADMNEDGDPDVVAILTDATHAKLAVFSGDGEGGLAAEAVVTQYPWESLFSSGPLVLGDLNNDAHVDVVIGYGLGTSVAFVLGAGTAQFGSMQRLAQGSETQPVVADVNNDGRLDLLSGTAAGLTTFLNNATPELFTNRMAFPSGGVPQDRSGLTFLDVDGGPMDFVYAFRDQGGPRVSKVSGNANGTFGAPSLQPVVAAGVSVVADLNNDSRQDLIVVGDLVNSSTPGPGFETFLVTGSMLTSTGSHTMDVRDPQSVDIVDLDGNGFRDIVIGHRGAYPLYPSALKYYPGLGAGQFGTGITVWSGVYLLSAAVGDLNGDAKPDVVVHYYGTEYIEAVLLNLGAGAFSAPTVASSSENDFPSTRFVIADVNHDGKKDLVGVHADLIVKLGAGDGTFGGPIRSRAPIAGWGDVELADFNGDTHVDLAVPSGRTVNISLGNGDGTFRAPLYFEAAGSTLSLSVADTDQDGRQDILIDTRDGNAGVLRARCL